MRTIINMNQGWLFCKNTSNIHERMGAGIDLPHTWNAKDGQDGGNDYFRGCCVYKKILKRNELPKADRYYLEFRGANSSADVYVGGEKIAHHDGGYSTWRAEFTNQLQEVTEIAVVVDNSPSESVYPQMADFTFYGGLYRDVNIVCVANTHFALDEFGSNGLKISPTVTGEDAQVSIEASIRNFTSGQRLVFTIYDNENRVVASSDGTDGKAVLRLPKVRLWKGLKDPYLYTCHAQIIENDTVLDNVSLRFGCRFFAVDPDKGFLLNGEEYPLRGVSRHQDRLGIGNALLPEHHQEDIDLIMELGATSVRLAHYQHDQYFYDLCDEKGLIVWAEIPYISKHLPSGVENTVSQIKELIAQNHHHPSIVVWGLSNEISIAGSDEGLLKNHQLLNKLAHEMDQSRLTTVAAVSMCKMDDPYLKIPDLVAYNHYFGWYGGETDMNGPWFDAFHQANPKTPIGCSEYGCEGLNWHSSTPFQGDYTEEYQAHYHEELIKQLFTRKYLWATYVWNMFDFGADARAEGGENGQNHKGLVTMDRKYKKDAFYAYKAWLSKEPFVHLCGKRYVDRVEDVTKVTVYSNQPEVELFVNGKSLGKQSTPDHFFRFDVPNVDESIIVAQAGALFDEGKIRKVEAFNESYRLREQGAVLNWFDVTAPDGRFSLNDKVSDILACPQGKAWFSTLATFIQEKMRLQKEKKDGGSGFEINLSDKGFTQMMGGFSVLRLVNMMSMANVSFSKEELLEMNKELNKIEKIK